LAALYHTEGAGRAPYKPIFMLKAQVLKYLWRVPSDRRLSLLLKRNKRAAKACDFKKQKTPSHGLFTHFRLLFGLFVAGNMMIGYISWVFFMPIWFLFRTSDLFFFVYSFLIMVLFILSARPEVRTMTKYRREGKLEEYMQGLYASSPRWRGMKRMQDTVDKLGKKMYILGIIVIFIIIILFMNLNMFPNLT